MDRRMQVPSGIYTCWKQPYKHPVNHYRISLTPRRYSTSNNTNLPDRALKAHIREIFFWVYNIPLIYITLILRRFYYVLVYKIDQVKKQDKRPFSVKPIRKYYFKVNLHKKRADIQSIDFDASSLNLYVILY